MCSRSAVNSGCPLKYRRKTDKTVSSSGNPNATIGIATATAVVSFSLPASDTALSMNPRNSDPESPRNTVAGLKLYRRNPRIAPASATVTIATNALPLSSDTTNTTSVENSAEPADKPSRPSIRLNAFEISSTQKTVNTAEIAACNSWYPLTIGNTEMRTPP